MYWLKEVDDAKRHWYGQHWLCGGIGRRFAVYAVWSIIPLGILPGGYAMASGVEEVVVTAPKDGSDPNPGNSAGTGTPGGDPGNSEGAGDMMDYSQCGKANGSGEGGGGQPCAPPEPEPEPEDEPVDCSDAENAEETRQTCISNAQTEGLKCVNGSGLNGPSGDVLICALLTEIARNRCHIDYDAAMESVPRECKE